MVLETKRLLLRPFEPDDLDALYLLLQDEEVNTFLPWFPARGRQQAERFYQDSFQGRPYSYAICRKDDSIPVGYIKADTGDGHELSYALRREFWHHGIVTEAGQALTEQLKKDHVPYLTATHDRNNPRSGGVMRQLGMRYCYSYVEQWQPKNFPVVFRMYQLNLDGQEDRVYSTYGDRAQTRFIEEGL